MRGRVARPLIGIALMLPALAPLGACSNNGPLPLTLADVTEPDTNTAVVVFDQDVIEGTDTVKAGVEEVYLVDTGRAIENVVANAGIKQVYFAVPDVFTTGDYFTADAASAFQWVGPTGRVYIPVTPCTVAVQSAFVADTRSTLLLETACSVSTAGGGNAVTILIKVRRVATPVTSP